MTTYKLQSAPMVYAPGVIRWLINGARFEENRAQMIKVAVDAWSIPETAATALITGEVAYVLEGAKDNESVVFQVKE